MSNPSLKAEAVTPTSTVSVKEIVRGLRLPIAILGALLIFGLIEPRVLSFGNFRNISVQASYLAIFAMAQTMVILTRGFDLSLGFTVSLVSVGASMAMVSVS